MATRPIRTLPVRNPAHNLAAHEFSPARLAALPRQAATAPASLGAELVFTLKASRPGFWLTTIWFYLMPHAGQFSANNGAFWLGLIYVMLPLGMLIYAGNDLSDAETDRLNPRKDSFLFGARPTPDQLFELPLRIFWIQVPFVALFAAIWGAKVLVWFWFWAARFTIVAAAAPKIIRFAIWGFSAAICWFSC